MPEYLAIIHYRNQQDDDGAGQPPSVDDVNAAFLRLERAGIAKVH